LALTLCLEIFEIKKPTQHAGFFSNKLD